MEVSEFYKVLLELVFHVLNNKKTAHLALFFYPMLVPADTPTVGRTFMVLQAVKQLRQSINTRNLFI